MHGQRVMNKFLGEPVAAVEISYRVKAEKPTGQGQPSDTETVVL